MSKPLSFIFFFLAPVIISAQGYFYTESTVLVDAGASIEIKGNAVINQAINGNGLMVMNGDNPQTLGGTAANMNNLKITNNANVSLNDLLWVNDTLAMESGTLLLGDEDVYLADNSVHTGNNSGFIQTNGAGVIERKLDSTPFTFHVGSGVEYFPITLTETGTADTFDLRAWDFIPNDGTSAGTAITSHVALLSYWLSDQVTGGNNLNISMQWNDTKNAVDFVQPYAVGIRYNGTNYVELDNCPTNVNSINPNIVSYTSILNTGTFGIGDSIYLTNIPTAYINPGDTTVCMGSSVIFSALPSGAAAYLWSTTANTQTINVSTAATYYVDITDSTGCTYRSNNVTLTTLALPATPTISQTGNDLSTGGGYATYQWYLNGSIISGATSSTYTATSNGTYAVVVSGSNGCTNTSANYNFNGLGIEGQNTSLNIYNQQGQLLIQLEGDEAQQVYIYDALGKVVYQQKFSSNLIPLELSHGMYVVRVIGNAKEYIKKMIF